MSFIRRHIARFAVAALFASAALLTYAAPAWEKVAAMSAEVVENAGSDYYEVRIIDRRVVLTVAHKTNVKVFTILGQLVADQQLEAGTWQIPLDNRGIYILKVGTATRRVTI